MNLVVAWLKSRQPIDLFLHGLREARKSENLQKISAQAPYRRGHAVGSVRYSREILTSSTRPR